MNLLFKPRVLQYSYYSHLFSLHAFSCTCAFKKLPTKIWSLFYNLSLLLNESFECIFKIKWIHIRQLRHDFRICKNVYNKGRRHRLCPLLLLRTLTQMYSFLYTRTHTQIYIHLLAASSMNDLSLRFLLIWSVFFCAPQSFYLIKATKCWKNRIYKHILAHSHPHTLTQL